MVNSEANTNTILRCNVDADADFEFQLVIEDGDIIASAYKGIDFVL
jgi:hypothetical protein